MPRIQARHPDAGASWWMDLVLAGLLLGASLSWSTYLAFEPTTLDLGLCLAFLLAGGVFACQGTVALRERTRH